MVNRAPCQLCLRRRPSASPPMHSVAVNCFGRCLLLEGTIYYSITVVSEAAMTTCICSGFQLHLFLHPLSSQSAVEARYPATHHSKSLQPQQHSMTCKVWKTCRQASLAKQITRAQSTTSNQLHVRAIISAEGLWFMGPWGPVPKARCLSLDLYDLATHGSERVRVGGETA